MDDIRIDEVIGEVDIGGVGGLNGGGGGGVVMFRNGSSIID